MRTQTNCNHISVTGHNLSDSRFARFNGVFPNSIKTAVGFLQPGAHQKTSGGMIDGKFRVYWVSSHRSPAGVKYNRLMCLRRRLFINREQRN